VVTPFISMIDPVNKITISGKINNKSGYKAGIIFNP